MVLSLTNLSQMKYDQDKEKQWNFLTDYKRCLELERKAIKIAIKFSDYKRCHKFSYKNTFFFFQLIDTFECGNYKYKCICACFTLEVKILLVC